MILPISAYANGQTILSGVADGRQVFAAFVAAAAPPATPDIAFLDFAGIEVATGSFLRESVLAFRDYARSTLPNLYPVSANLSLAVREELEFVLRHRRDAMWVCDLDGGRSSNPAVLGELDASHRAAFDLITGLGGATAPELAKKGDKSVGATAWNNRLAYLAGRGLLIERRAGKAKAFTPVLETR